MIRPQIIGLLLQDRVNGSALPGEAVKQPAGRRRPTGRRLGRPHIL